MDAIRGNAASRISKIHQEISSIQDSTTSAHREWSNYIQKLSTNYMEDISVLESGKDGLDDGLRNWYEQLHENCSNDLLIRSYCYEYIAAQNSKEQFHWYYEL